MIKIWFLMALMSYPTFPTIAYKGFGGFETKEKCEQVRVAAENIIVDYEYRRGNTVYIKTFCMEMDAFEPQSKFNKKMKKIKNDA